MKSLSNTLLERLQLIQPLSEAHRQQALQRLDQLTKPPGSLGKLEALAVQLSGITGSIKPDVSKKAVIVMAADHGVCEEGISAFPQEVTAQMVMNFLEGGAAVNVLARQAGADVFCADIGVKQEMDLSPRYVKKVKYGTENMVQGPAMSEEEAAEAILQGIQLVEKLSKQGYRLFSVGEMGIGNTTASAAMISVFTGFSPAEVVGRGTGIDDAMLGKKQQIVQKAIDINAPDPENPLDVLSKVGGLEIAGMTGVILGAAMHRHPVLLDGFISTAAALVAAKLSPLSTAYMIPSHLSQEKGHLHALNALGLQPMLQLDMRLGEGTGAVLCFNLVEAAMKIMNEMATFESAGVSNS